MIKEFVMHYIFVDFFFSYPVSNYESFYGGMVLIIFFFFVYLISVQRIMDYSCF